MAELYEDVSLPPLVVKEGEARNGTRMAGVTTTSSSPLAINRAGWDRVAPVFHGGTALPEYGPLAPTEDALRLLELSPDLRALELGCGSGHSLRYLA